MVNEQWISQASGEGITVETTNNGLQLADGGIDLGGIPIASCDVCGLSDGHHTCGECGGEWQVFDEDVSKTEHECTRCFHRKYKQ